MALLALALCIQELGRPVTLHPNLLPLCQVCACMKGTHPPGEGLSEKCSAVMPREAVLSALHPAEVQEEVPE